ncbi:MAG: serine/threonine protein kinase [Myxococcales bacterium]|nr:serine/threonine protein kinase [Myxococcales bacterium]
MPDPMTHDEDDEVTTFYVLGVGGRPQAQRAGDAGDDGVLELDELDELDETTPALELDDALEDPLDEDVDIDDDAETQDAYRLPQGPWRPSELVGVTINERYRVEKLIGLGGMGAVYRGHHVVIEKLVAIKVMNPVYSASEVDLERFLREARSASQIRHENVVDITDFGYSEGGQAFLVMEYLDGEDLATLLARERRISWKRLVAIALQICAGLKAAHARGIIHRDMKPDNCFIVKREGGRDLVKVLDFGIAKVVNERRETSLTGQALIGTPEYVAPELVLGEPPDARVDIYALGVVMYEALTGRVPFRSDTYMGTLQLHLRGELVAPDRAAPDAEIPAGISDIIARALSREPARRFQDIESLEGALRETCGLAPVAAAPLTADVVLGETTVEEQLAAIDAPAVQRLAAARLAAAPRYRDERQRRLLLMIAAPVAVVAVVALLWFALGRSPAPALVVSAAPDESPIADSRPDDARARRARRTPRVRRSRRSRATRAATTTARRARGDDATGEGDTDEGDAAGEGARTRATAATSRPPATRRPPAVEVSPRPCRARRS